MASHDASKQALGYLFQSQVALYALLSSEDSEVKVCLEKFDDVSFHKDYEPIEQLQIKYHSNEVNLSNSSIDLWRTLKSWIDSVNNDISLLSNTTFYIITTGGIGKDSVIGDIVNKISSDEIYKKLIMIAEEGKKNNKENSTAYKCYNSFLTFDAGLAKQLIGRIEIKPNVSNPKEISDKILQKLRLFTVKKYEQTVCDKLMGWWYQKIIECLQSDNPIFITYDELRRYIFSVVTDLSDENLPLDVTEKEIESIEEEENVKNIIRQLDLIDSKKGRINNAVKNFYRAFAQRSKWIRENLVTPEEIDHYDERLYKEWEFQFSEIMDEVDDATKEDEKKELGKSLYKVLMEKSIPIRPKVDDMDISRGSFNNLSNDLKIGWHPDYEERLRGDSNK